MMERLTKLWDEALEIWMSGGWAMYALAMIAVVMFGLGVHVYLRLKATGYRSVPERRWRRWIDQPEERRGRIGELLDFGTGGHSLEATSLFFKQLRASETAPFDRDLKVMKTCVGAAPLVGLLGTVTGMLTTFGALGTGTGGEQTMTKIAAGISEALVTTETGLVIALPGLFFQHQLARGFEGYKAFLAHVETVCSQNLYRRVGRASGQQARRAAWQEIMGTLRLACDRSQMADATTAAAEADAAIEHWTSPRESHGPI
ncbi:MAG: MotA/TolQ/ExbB proton channel family protein [Planctomycetota bacterium]